MRAHKSTIENNFKTKLKNTEFLLELLGFLLVFRVKYQVSFLIFYRMYWVFLGFLSSVVAAQSSYDLETRAVSFPGKPSSLGPLYSSGLSSAQGFRDNSYEDNAVTPTPSPTPIFRNVNQQPVSTD